MKQLVDALKKVANPDKAAAYPKFFQAMPGGYGEGDRFLGVTVPNIRLVAKQFADIDRKQLSQSLRSEWHECRLATLIILERQFRQAKSESKAEFVGLFLDHLDYVNNWDLVDSSAPKILGEHLISHPEERVILDSLANSDHLWRQRVAVVATMPLIKQGEFQEILKLCKRLLNHPHDLMHKAMGWMLRDVGDKDVDTLHRFLDQHARQMPRTMLRYCIEHQSQDIRRHYMSKE